jgi:uroporphyrinogen-III decarboxylase
MDRKFYIDLAQKGLRMPVGADLVLREKSDAEDIMLDGRRLGIVVAEAAHRFNTPLAFPLMDLKIEKSALGTALGIDSAELDTFHFTEAPTQEQFDRVRSWFETSATPRMAASGDALAYVAENTDLIPVGMSIGPFSLMTKLLADPITAIYMAGLGTSAAEDPEVAAVEACLSLAEMVILNSLAYQQSKGAKAVFICEPAANVAFLSPKQLEDGADIFERYVMQPNLRLKASLDELGMDLIFHNCGELVDMMVKEFTRLDPVILSLGSSRILWEDSKLVSKSIVLYGNLPTKKFYSDELVSVDQAVELACELIEKMKATGHPFILGSECDVLSVEGCETSIRTKVSAFMNCSCHP